MQPLPIPFVGSVFHPTDLSEELLLLYGVTQLCGHDRGLP